MLRRILATLCALFCISASSSISNPHTVEVSTTRTLRFESSHVFLGVAVLGHHVSKISSGWLIKQKGGGFLHIDWSSFGNWKGLTRSEEGPRDVSHRQMDEVIHAIERLGYPRTAIRAWRVPAPVGFDDFHDGDKVLTIGEIMVDLGTLDQARNALDRWWDVISKDDDPFDQIPLTNVRYSIRLFFQPNCANLTQALHTQARTETAPIAKFLAASVRTTTTLSDYDLGAPSNTLCPKNSQPNFYNVSGVPERKIYDSELSELQLFSVTYQLAGQPDEKFSPPAADDLPKSTRRFEFSLNEPYASTFGYGGAKIKPDAVILHFKYNLGTKARNGYTENLRTAQLSISHLQDMVDRNEIFIRRLPSTDNHDAIDVFVLVPRHKLQTISQIQEAGWRRDQPFNRDEYTYTALVSHCAVTMNAGVQRALAESRTKAEHLAQLMHARIRNLAAARVSNIMGMGIACGFDPRASLASLTSSITASSSFSIGENLGEISIGPTIDAAWALAGMPHSAKSLVRTQYRSETQGMSSISSLESRALTLAARQAIVDNPRVISLFETEPSTQNAKDGSHWVTETVIVLR